MADFVPFPAVRYSGEHPIDEVIAPPYDVLSPEDVARHLQRHPHNIVHLTLGGASGDEPEDKYRSAGDELYRWLAEGVLVEEPSESFYLYRCDYTWGRGEGTSAGILGALALEALGEGRILPHERTMPAPKIDRLRLMRSTRANLEPLWFVTSEDRGLVSGVMDAARRLPALSDVSVEGVRHRLWRLPDDLTSEVVSALETATVVIADGHHRYETSWTYRQERAASDGAGPWDRVLALIEEPGRYAPALRPIHRLVEDLPPSSIEKLAPLKPFEGGLDDLIAGVLDSGPGLIGVASRGSSWTLEASGELDVAWLSAEVLDPSRASPVYEHDLDRAVKAVDGGATGFLMAPVPLDTVLRAAIEGKRMPPKTTLFWPKPPSGLLMRSLDHLDR